MVPFYALTCRLIPVVPANRYFLRVQRKARPRQQSYTSQARMDISGLLLLTPSDLDRDRREEEQQLSPKSRPDTD